MHYVLLEPVPSDDIHLVPAERAWNPLQRALGEVPEERLALPAELGKALLPKEQPRC